MRRILIGLALAFLALPAWAQTREQNWAQCTNISNPDASISACTAIIQSGQEMTVNLAIAYKDRAMAYGAKGLHEQEISDAAQAIALNPNDAMPYNSRAWSYHLLNNLLNKIYIRGDVGAGFGQNVAFRDVNPTASNCS